MTKTKRFSRILTFALAMLMVVAMAVPAFASETPVTGLQGQLQDIDQQLAHIEADPQLSTTHKDAATAKAEYLKLLLSGQQMATTRATFKSNYVPYYRQETINWCGAASIQQTLGHYYYSPMPTQATIMQSIGTAADTNLMRNYLNNLLNPSAVPGSIWYSVWWNSASKNMQSTILSVADSGTPIIVHVGRIFTAGRSYYTQTSKWAYTTTGHYMSISGYANSGAQIELTDPYIMYSAQGQSDSRYSGGKYQIDFTVLDAVGDRLII